MYSSRFESEIGSGGGCVLIKIIIRLVKIILSVCKKTRKTIKEGMDYHWVVIPRGIPCGRLRRIGTT